MIPLPVLRHGEIKFPIVEGRRMCIRRTITSVAAGFLIDLRFEWGFVGTFRQDLAFVPLRKQASRFLPSPKLFAAGFNVCFAQEILHNFFVVSKRFRFVAQLISENIRI